jgi:hypothetical protein
MLNTSLVFDMTFSPTYLLTALRSEKRRRVGMRSKLYTSLVIIVLLCLVGWTGYGQRTRSGWEYKVDPVPDAGSMQQLQAQANERLINQRAGEGWELTAVGSSYFYFKRAR